MQKVYYNRMKNTHLLPLAFVLPLCQTAPSFPAALSHATQQMPEASTRPLTASAVDSHEGLTIAAEPWLTADRYKTVFPKKTPFGAGVVAIKVTLRNDS